MRLNLSSEIVLNKVPVEFYKPKTTVEYSEISRMEKIHTDIFASMTEGASHVADGIEAGIKAAQHEGKFYVMALGTGSFLWFTKLPSFFLLYGTNFVFLFFATSRSLANTVHA